VNAVKEGQVNASVPINLIKVKIPDDGLPCVSDWITCCISFIFSGSRLGREPIDLNWGVPHQEDQEDAQWAIKKGFTRLLLGFIEHSLFFFPGSKLFLFSQVSFE
jgi:hypothetical protein